MQIMKQTLAITNIDKHNGMLEHNVLLVIQHIEKRNKNTELLILLICILNRLTKQSPSDQNCNINYIPNSSMHNRIPLYIIDSFLKSGKMTIKNYRS